jgi:hypothetical protein
MSVCVSRKFQLLLTSTVMLGSESCGTHDHILLSHDSASQYIYTHVRAIYLPTLRAICGTSIESRNSSPLNIYVESLKFFLYSL